jgi:hypothetical protein
MKGKSGCVFVKTSCRSAKDTAIYNLKFREIYTQILSKKSTRTDNDKIMCLLETGMEVLKMYSAMDVLETFCSSERVAQDMRIALEHPDRFSQNFIIRQWIDITPDMEFRGFVNNGKLNALSQYNYLVYYPHLVLSASELSEKIQAYHANVIHPKLAHKFKEYIIDFAFADGRLWVIELNPFLPSTDAALFSWKSELSILTLGPFQFRVQTKIAVGAKALLSLAWREILEEIKIV